MTAALSCYNIVLTMQTQTIFKAGNSEVIAIPKEIRKQMNLKKGSKVVLEVAADGKTLIVSKAGRGKKVSSVTHEFIKTLERVNKRYGPALAKLAKL